MLCSENFYDYAIIITKNKLNNQIDKLFNKNLDIKVKIFESALLKKLYEYLKKINIYIKTKKEDILLNKYKEKAFFDLLRENLKKLAFEVDIDEKDFDGKLYILTNGDEKRIKNKVEYVIEDLSENFKEKLNKKVLELAKKEDKKVNDVIKKYELIKKIYEDKKIQERLKKLKEQLEERKSIKEKAIKNIKEKLQTLSEKSIDFEPNNQVMKTLIENIIKNKKLEEQINDIYYERINEKLSDIQKVLNSINYKAKSILRSYKKYLNDVINFYIKEKLQQLSFLKNAIKNFKKNMKTKIKKVFRKIINKNNDLNL